MPMCSIGKNDMLLFKMFSLNNLPNDETLALSVSSINACVVIGSCSLAVVSTIGEVLCCRARMRGLRLGSLDESYRRFRDLVKALCWAGKCDN